MADFIETDTRTPRTDATAPAVDCVNPPPVRIGMSSANPNIPPAQQAVAACFPNAAEASKVSEDLVGSGVPGESVLVISEREAKRSFLKGYLHRDNDRHTHSNAAAAFSALGGAFAVGLIGVVIASQYGAGLLWPIVAALVGGVIGAGLGSLLGSFALRPADDRSIDIVEDLCKAGTLVAVRESLGGSTFSLENASQILSRHHGRVFRLRPHLSQADLPPGDTRTFA
jgi:hypothetical protein